MLQLIPAHSAPCLEANCLEAQSVDVPSVQTQFSLQGGILAPLLDQIDSNSVDPNSVDPNSLTQPPFPYPSLPASNTLGIESPALSARDESSGTLDSLSSIMRLADEVEAHLLPSTRSLSSENTLLTDPLYIQYQEAAKYLGYALTTCVNISSDGPGRPFTLEVGIPSPLPWTDGSTITALTTRPGLILTLGPQDNFFQRDLIAFKLDIDSIEDPQLREDPYFKKMRGMVFEGIFIKISPLGGPANI